MDAIDYKIFHIIFLVATIKVFLVLRIKIVLWNEVKAYIVIWKKGVRKNMKIMHIVEPWYPVK